MLSPFCLRLIFLQKYGTEHTSLKTLNIIEFSRAPRGWKGRLAKLREEMRRLNDTVARKREALEYWETLEHGDR